MTDRYPTFAKIPRLHRDVYITEKVDGTNGLVAVLDDAGLSRYRQPNGDPVPCVNVAPGVHVLAGSRSRWVWPGQDNHGFAAWVHDNAHALADLGLGIHYGEWYGRKIRRGYGLTDQRFALFNTARWTDERPACCDVVPVLTDTTGERLNIAVRVALECLRDNGSRIAPGFMNPEGVVVYHSAANSYFKITLDGDELPKAFARRATESSFALMEGFQ